MEKQEVQKLLFEIIDDESVFDDSTDLISSGLLDSFAFIELFERLEDCGIVLQPTRIDRNKLRSIDGILELINTRETDK